MAPNFKYASALAIERLARQANEGVGLVNSELILLMKQISKARKAELKARVLDVIAGCKATAEEWYGVKLPDVEVKFNLRGKVAGKYRHSRNMKTGEITKECFMFHMRFLDAYEYEYLGDTVPHEYAHFVTNHINGLDPGHGKGWQDAMRVLDVEATRRHGYDLSVIGYHKYICECRQVMFSPEKHKNIVSGKIKVNCGVCNETFSTFAASVKSS